MDGFTELVSRWFADRFPGPTEIQRLAWPAIRSGEDVLVAAPTGSGKTLAAFLVAMDDLVRKALRGELTDAVHTVYVSPLKALSNDIHRNLEVPLSELQGLAAASGVDLPPIRALVRTGDSTSSQRQSLVRRPPHILVTTPESLYLLLVSPKAREALRQTRTIIVDEIHALARDKRGSHLALTIERLEHLCASRPTRIGLSATQKPIEHIARFLVGAGRTESAGRPCCAIVDVGHSRSMDIDIEIPSTPLGAVATNEHWGQFHDRLVDLIESHRSTLLFVNTRRMAERISHQLAERIGRDKVCSHHGSLSREIRFDAERRLKAGELKALVATASLELGIDVGAIDLVCQIGSPRSIAAVLQRVGRSGHSLAGLPKGRLFALTRDELIEMLATLRSIRRGVLDAVEIPIAPLDILAQQVFAAVSVEDWNEEDLFALVRRAWPYRDLTRETFDEILELLAGTGRGNAPRGASLHRDRVHGKLRAPRGARIIASTCGGAIPENADYRVVTTEGAVVGSVNEDFAIESLAGDVFLLGTTSWRVLQIRPSEVVVEDAHGAPPSIPFWLGEAPGRTAELSHEVSDLRRELSARISTDRPTELAAAIEWLANETGLRAESTKKSADGATIPSAIEQAVEYVALQKIALGVVPTETEVVFERFFDEMGGMQLVIHAPFGSRVNRAWGLALRKRFCRSFNFELQASADDDGVVLSLGPQHSFPIEDLFAILTPKNARHMLEQAVLDSPVFKVRWRWNATRALLVLRCRNGKRVPPALQRFRADDLLTAVFPDSTACLENRPENVEIPDHPIVHQSLHDSLHEAADFDRWMSLLQAVERGEIRYIPRDTIEPSPFSHQRLNMNPYAFLDDAPLEERRSRAVSIRRAVSLEEIGDLAALDREAIEQVREQAWPRPRDKEELHEAVYDLCVVTDEDVKRGGWHADLDALIATGRATGGTVASGARFYFSVERLPILRCVYASLTLDTSVSLPAHLDRSHEEMEARTAIVRGRMEAAGPTTASALGKLLALDVPAVEGALGRLEAGGAILRGKFDPHLEGEQWCERRLLARIHRRTIEGARRRIQPVSAEDYLRFLFRYHGVTEGTPRRTSDREGLFDVIDQLAGIEAPAGAWEHDIFPARLDGYDPRWLDELAFGGAIGWGRLVPPLTPVNGHGSNGNDPSATRKRSSGLNRVVPISIFPRENLGWLLPRERTSAESLARSDALEVWRALCDRGALFFSDLVACTGLLAGQVEIALSELTALGLVAADGFAGIRSLVAPMKHAIHRMRPGRQGSQRVQHRTAGRWVPFPPPTAVAVDRTERWAWLLLQRYGVVFRDLLAREAVAPPWWELVRVYRLLEARGQVQGGRFVTAVGSEQYALPGVVGELREVRDVPADDGFVILSAADPLNLTGILDAGPRVAATRGNAIAYRGGQRVAARVGGRLELQESLPAEQINLLSRQLRMLGSVRRGHAGAFGETASKAK